MKSLVCISHVPDTTTKIKYTDDGRGLDKLGVTFVINPYDEYGLVRALELKEGSGSGQITVLCVGRADVEATLRKALAIGADDAVRIDGDPEDGMYVAQQIAAHAQGKGYNLIFFGKESIDSNGAEVPGMVAELLDLPFISQCTKLEISGSQAIGNREIDGGHEVMSANLPAVISCQKGIAEWRIPNMRGIMMAKTKPLKVEPAVAAEIAVSTEKLELPPAKGGCIFVDPSEAGKLITLLHEKGLV